MIATIRSFALFAAMAAAAAPLAAQTLQLADGKVLLGVVDQPPDGEGLRVRRLDNGGLLDLRWDQLSPATALRIKKEFDLAGDTHDEIVVSADEVEYMLNGQKQTMIGKIVDTTAEAVLVQKKGQISPVPKGELRTRRTVVVPATQIYTKDEFYKMRLDEVQPGNSPEKHVRLAEDLIKFRDYERASEHLKKAKELGNSADPQHLDATMQRLQRYQEAAKEREMLDQIQAARSRAQLGDFEKGKKLIAQFQKDFPQSKLKTDFDVEKKRFDDARTRFLTEQVSDQWRRSIQIVADKKVVDPAVTLAAARQYAEGKMTDDIVARLAQLLRIEATEVKELWAGREKYTIGKRTEHFAYGDGSWVLGEAAILKGTQAGKVADRGKDKGKEAPAGNAQAIDRLARLLREAMDRRRAAAQGESGSRKLTEEDWWKQASRLEKVGWLRAYYAEFGNQLKVTYQTAAECISCYGAGTTTDMGPDGKPVQTECFLCQGTKWTRSFKAY